MSCQIMDIIINGFNTAKPNVVRNSQESETFIAIVCETQMHVVM